MKSIRELTSGQRFGILGGKSLAECAKEAEQRWALGGGFVWPTGPGKGPARAADPAPAKDEAEELRLHLERCAVPDRIAEVLRVGARPTPGVVSIREWVKSPLSFAVLHGDPDVGKTVAAASAFLAARRVLRWDGGRSDEWDSVNCAFEQASEVARMPMFGDEARGYWSHLGRIRWLVLDDLGSELMTEPWLSTLDGLLNERFGKSGCRTVLTTNISCKRSKTDEPSPFEKRYGARIARRVRESGSVIAVAKEAA